MGYWVVCEQIQAVVENLCAQYPDVQPRKVLKAANMFMLIEKQSALTNYICNRYLVSCCISHLADANKLTKSFKRVRKQERAYMYIFSAGFSKMKHNNGN